MKTARVVDLSFGPFKTALLQQAIDEKLRHAAIQYIDQAVLPAMADGSTFIKGHVTSHYDAPQFSGRPELTCRYFLDAQFETSEGVVGATGEIIYNIAAGTFTASRVKPLQTQVLKPRPRPWKKPGRTGHYVQFPASDVTPSDEALDCVNLKSALEQSTRTRLMICPEENRQVVKAADFHPLIAAAAIAFQQHYPLVLSPDMIWLALLEGVSQHIQNNAEQLRSRLVRHQGKIELVVDLGQDGLPRDHAGMLAVAERFCEMIARHLAPDKCALLEARFSTTTITERIAAHVVLMDALQPYFDYVCRIICGIPSVILEGTVADWELLEQKVNALQESDLDLSWWTQQLIPLCRQFSRAAAGDVDTEHWRNLCKIEKLYGVDDMNGWLLKFVPYVRDGLNELPIHRNPVLDSNPPRKPRQIVGRTIHGCTSDMLPTGLSSVPVTIMTAGTSALSNVRFVAGFTGVEQAHDDLGLRPVIGWAISEPPAIDTLIQKLQTEHGCIAPNLRDGPDIKAIFESLPADVWRFYHEIESAHLTFPQPNRWGETGCFIIPLPCVRPIAESVSMMEELAFLRDQGLISPKGFAEREAFIKNYGALVRIGQAGHTARVEYVFGCVGPDWDAAVYRWTGERRSEAFQRVADSFTEWLTTLVTSSQPGLRPCP